MMKNKVNSNYGKPAKKIPPKMEALLFSLESYECQNRYLVIFFNFKHTFGLQIDLNIASLLACHVENMMLFGASYKL